MIQDHRHLGSPTMFQLINAQCEKNNQPEGPEEPEEPKGAEERDKLDSVTKSKSD